jgi:CubicO group peptidase (beta-lactamase class C family)
VAALQELLDRAVAAGPVPGVVALVSGPGGAEVACAGVRTVGGEPMARDCLFRIASISKPILAAATLALHEQRRLGLDDPAQRWLPELAEPVVLRALDGPIEDVVPAVRPVTVRHLLTLQGGHGQPERCDAPIASVLTARLGEGPPRPAEHPEPVEWMRRLSGLPLLHQPGEGWTYNTGYDILGVLLARLTGAPLAEVLTATVLEPMGMTDTGFWTEQTDRLVSYYRRGEAGLELVDPPDGQWAQPPRFPSGAGGLLSSVDDWSAFGQMLLAGGEHRGRRVLAPESVRLMTTVHVDGGPEHLFLDGQGWGMGGSVDLRRTHRWNVPGRYGWVGGTGTAGYIIPSTHTVVVWLSQVELGGPDDAAAIADVLTCAAQSPRP